MILCFLASAILFLLSLPLGAVKLAQDAIILGEKSKQAVEKSPIGKMRDTALSTIRSKRKSKKFANTRSKAVVMTATALKASASALMHAMRFLSVLLTTLCTMVGSFELIAILILVGAVASVPILYGTATVNETGSSYQSSSNYTSTEDEDIIKQTSYGGVVIDASIEEMLNWSDEEKWYNLTGGRYKSRAEATARYHDNFEEEKAYWDNYVVTIKVPIWEWADRSKTAVIEREKHLKVNPNLATYWTNFFTDLHEAPEHYVINSLGCYNYRAAVNASSSISAHAMGCAVDINPSSDGMGYRYTAGEGSDVWKPWRSVNDIPPDKAYLKQEVCCFDSTWRDISNSYKLNWGATWTNPDGMHFSFPAFDGGSSSNIVYGDYSKCGVYHPY